MSKRHNNRPKDRKPQESKRTRSERRLIRSEFKALSGVAW